MGRGGPIRITDAAHKDALTEAFLESCVQMGIPVAEDYNGEKYEGVGYFQFSMRNGRRCSTEVGYLRDARKRPNLDVETFAMVDRLLCEGNRTGRIVREEGRPRRLRTSAEGVRGKGSHSVCRCALLAHDSGALGHRRLGPPAAARGISPVMHLPGVGENLQDHLNVRTTYECTRPITINDAINNWTRGARMALQYVFTRRGLMATPTIAIHALVKSEPGLETP